MSYTFLQGQGVASSAASFSDIAAFVRSKLNLTAAKSSCNASATECSRGSRSGTTCGPLTDDPGAESSIASAAVFPVRTSAAQAEAQASTASGLDCGPSSPGSLARYNPGSRSWRTAQCLLDGGLEEYSETFPRWGTMRNGELFQQPTPELPICANAFGFWHPTPCARDWKGASDGQNLDVSRWTSWLHFTHFHATKTTYPNPCCSEAVMGWPIMWSALKPLAMDKYRQWLSSHGIPCASSGEIDNDQNEKEAAK